MSLFFCLLLSEILQQGCPDRDMLQCRQTCKYGFARDRNGCLTCQCYQDIWAAQLTRDRFCDRSWPCLFLCPDGYQTDPSGCNLCWCRQGPLSQAGCPTIGCTMKCDTYGYITTPRGCPCCACRGRCEPYQCPSQQDCPLGYIIRKDSNGCDVCECKPCPFLGCELVCGDEGYVHDTVTRCKQCQCCPVQQCPNRCTEYARGPDGCRTCQCVGAPEPCPDITLTCPLRCPGGFRKDAQGCDLCECVPFSDIPTVPCEQAPSVLNCQNGGKYCGTNRLGCRECCCYMDSIVPNCRNRVEMCRLMCDRGFERDPITQCETCKCIGSDCPGMEGCTQTCPNGYRRDSRNCPICQCQ